MGWAENRIERYHRGAAANWLERRMLEHANPVHFPLALAASIGLGYGLWRHSWPWIIGASALAVSGHVYCWTRENEQIRRRLVAPGRDGSVVRASCVVSIGPEGDPDAERADTP